MDRSSNAEDTEDIPEDHKSSKYDTSGGHLDFHNALDVKERYMYLRIPMLQFQPMVRHICTYHDYSSYTSTYLLFLCT